LPRRRGANSVPHSCTSAGAGRRRNRSNVPALMCNEAVSTGLMNESATPNETLAIP
jgi:hypothetical protein